ncbi:MAG: DNA-binding response regulator [Pseudomonadota bacterium]|uniref:response regulator transcription factor n=1 Tax=Thermithiobacillus tepidarius TaxID=929 RepID=UPI000428F19B|nr:response regulator transcription factor [Thermithiobacillus tepidarius]
MVDEPAAPQVRIFVLANPGIYVDGLVQILSQQRDIAVVACVAPGALCLEQFRAMRPDVLLVHTGALQYPLSDFLARFRAAAGKLPVLVFGHGLDDELIYNLIRAGAQGYIHENMTSEQVLEAVKEVRHGGLWIEKRVLEKLVYSALEVERLIEDSVKDRIQELQKLLTKREAELLRLVLEGLSTKEIADKMCLSEPTVKLHLGNIFKKFDVTNRSQLILMTFARVCPVNNMIRLFRIALDKRRLAKGEPPVIKDPLVS